MELLLVKMSSLGDVVHALPAVTDAARAIPGLAIDWVVEEAYEAIPGWHPAVRRTIPVALRRWRKSPWAMLKENEWFRFRSRLKKRQYDLVLDAQGLMKSGWISLQARGPVAGRSRGSAREPLASAFYNRTHEIDLSLTEVEQVRQLFALALNYPRPLIPADFGIDSSRLSPSSVTGRYAVLAHGAAWQSKLWPVESWISLGKHLAAKGLKPVLPWGSEEEHCRAERIADACRGQVLPKLNLSELARVLAAAELVTGLDTGLTHVAIALGTPAITLYGPSVPVYDAVRNGRVIHLASSNSKEVDTGRQNSVPLEAVLEAVERSLSEPTIPA
jgi:heptosyltransferase-1